MVKLQPSTEQYFPANGLKNPRRRLENFQRQSTIQNPGVLEPDVGGGVLRGPHDVEKE